MLNGNYLTTRLERTGKVGWCCGRGYWQPLSHFLKHRGDRAAFQAYLDRINQRPLRIIASPDDPDFDENVQVAIRRKLEAARNK
jgi:hypothetical protein